MSGGELWASLREKLWEAARATDYAWRSDDPGDLQARCRTATNALAEARYTLDALWRRSESPFWMVRDALAWQLRRLADAVSP
jgi:hypothetical protein